jgi:hypothetical protein
MMCRVLLLLLLLWTTPALAWDFVCTGTRPHCANTDGLNGYLRGLDLHEVTNPACTPIPDEPSTLTQTQRDLIATVAASHPNGRCHLKVVSGLAAEMTQGEKDAVNAAIQAVLDEQQAYEDAATNNDLCNATLAELDTAKTTLMNNLLGDIAGITNIATNQTELTDMMTRLVNALEKLMKCIRGRAGPP